MRSGISYFKLDFESRGSLKASFFFATFDRLFFPKLIFAIFFSKCLGKDYKNFFCFRINFFNFFFQRAFFIFSCLSSYFYNLSLSTFLAIFSHFFTFNINKHFWAPFRKYFFGKIVCFFFRIFKFFKLHIYNLFVKQIFDIFWHFLTVSSSPQSYKPLFFFILSANSQFSIFVIFMNFLFNS